MPPARPPTGGPPRVTLKDVARHLGVSVATVSNAYNRPDQLSPDLRARILRAALTLGYRGPDPLARSLRRGQTGVIGVVYDAPLDYAFADPAAALFLGSVAHTLQGHALNLLLLACPDGPHPIQGASVDGFIVSVCADGSPLLTSVLNRGLPTVLVEQSPQPGAALVTLDDRAGAQAAAAHLAALGHTHLGVLSLPASPDGHATYRTVTDRLAGYRQGAPHATLHVSAAAHNTPQAAEAAALNLLAAQPQVTALLCMSDVLAQGALNAARQARRPVPQALSVTGFDDLPGSAALNLTTVWQPTREKGQRAGEALLALLRGEQTPPLTLPTRLVERGTTAPPPGTLG